MNLKGKTVIVPKGTPVRSLHPQRGDVRPAGRSLKVKVNHMLPAYRYLLATRYRVGTPDMRTHFEGNDQDQENACLRLGLPCRNDQEVRKSLESLVDRATVDSPYAHGKIDHLWVELEPEMVCWAGSGGYWCEAPASAVRVVEQA